jgi:SAM-dependent methyltransferase
LLLFYDDISAMPLQFTDLLDPRKLASGEAPQAGCVNIPMEELPKRVHELPRPGQEVKVVGDVALLEKTIKVLQELDRRGVVGSPYTANGPFRLWRPNAWVERMAEQFEPGVALDLACGTGRDAVFLGDLGWSVTAVDHLPDALALASDLQRRYAPASEIDWVCSPVESFSGGTRYDLITTSFFLDRELLARVQEWLCPGGSLVMETFTVAQHEEQGRPRRSWCLEPGELRSLCASLDVVDYAEGLHDKGHTARVWARKPL